MCQIAKIYEITMIGQALYPLKTYEPAYLFKKPKCFGMRDKSVSKCRMSSVSRDALCFRLDQVVSCRSIDLKCGSTANNWTISQPPVRMLSSLNCTYSRLLQYLYIYFLSSQFKALQIFLFKSRT